VVKAVVKVAQHSAAPAHLSQRVVPPSAPVVAGSWRAEKAHVGGSWRPGK
jgi:hypothetical protein